MDFAPVLIFCYNRKEHLEKVIDSLRRNPQAVLTELYIYSDAAKNEKDKSQVKEVREYLSSIDGFKKITIIERKENYGLAKSIISGVSEVVNLLGRVIVLEDDIIVSPFFLTYMNEMLDLYKDDFKVASIHGYIYPTKKISGSTFFIRGADCWGWATWKRAWNHFEPDGKKLLEGLNKGKLTSEFNFDNSYPFSGMLEDQIAGKNNSWAIRWNASAFLNEMYTLYPTTSYVYNIGLDNTGTHCGETSVYDVQMVKEYRTPSRIEVVQSKEGFNAIRGYFRARERNIFHNLLAKLKRMVGK